MAQTEILGISFVQRHGFNFMYLFLISIQKSFRCLAEGSVRKTLKTLASVSFIKELNESKEYLFTSHYYSAWNKFREQRRYQKGLKETCLNYIKKSYFPKYMM